VQRLAPAPEEGVAVANYVALIDWTEKGVGAFKDSVDRSDQANKALEGVGARFKDIYWTLGGHDIVAIIEAPDDESVAAGLLAVAAQGNIRTQTMRAFSADEMRAVIERAG
jgi:uncharacterized protein with GYD domain